MAPRDWRKPEDYADLDSMDLSSLAWEFLRRDPVYRRDWDSADEAEAAARWALRFAVDPDLDAAEGPVIWTLDVASAHALELQSSATGSVTLDALRAVAVGARAGREGAWLRLRGGLQVLAPPDLRPGEGLAAICPLDLDLPLRLGALRALARLLRRGGAVLSGLSAHGRRRAVLMARALDGRAQGASYRDIAMVLIGQAPSGAAWRVSSGRDVAIRLCRSAAVMMRGGYRRLLRRSR